MRTVSIVVVSHGHDRYMPALLESIRACEALSEAQVIVVDNVRSFDAGLRATLERHRATLVTNLARRNFSVNNNIGASIATGDLLFFLNPDTRVLSVDRAALDRVRHGGLRFPRLVNPDGSTQDSGRRYPSFTRQLGTFALSFFGARRSGVPGDDWYFAAAMLVERRFFFEIGGFDEIFPLYCEDTELCHRVNCRSGEVALEEGIRVLHHLGGESKGRYRGRAVVSNLLLRARMLRNARSGRRPASEAR